MADEDSVSGLEPVEQRGVARFIEGPKFSPDMFVCMLEALERIKHISIVHLSYEFRLEVGDNRGGIPNMISKGVIPIW